MIGADLETLKNTVHFRPPDFADYPPRRINLPLRDGSGDVLLAQLNMPPADDGKPVVVLIHGLTGTPTEMRFVAKGLNRNGFTVHAMQLAGHCGDEQDLLQTGWRDWYRSVCEAADELRGEVDHMFVAGLSMGALLALKLAADRPDEVDGVGLYGTT